MKLISVIGHFGVNGLCTGGQSIKTVSLVNALEEKYGAEEVKCFATTGKKRDIFLAPYFTISAMLSSKNIIILPARNGLSVFAPLLFAISNIIKKRRLHYVVIGGWLPDFLKKKKVLSFILKQFSGIYVETNVMKKCLEQQGFANVIVMPNFKNLESVAENKIPCQYGEPYMLCTFSRVMKEKGIEDAVATVIEINEESGRTIYALDIYGEVDPGQMGWFEAMENTFPNYVKYKGLVSYNESVNILKEYYALLFPTYYEGEGFAGTLLDAMAAGIPSIVSDWKYNREIVKEGINGYVFTTHNIEMLKEKLLGLTPEMRKAISKTTLLEYEKYKPENIIKVLNLK